MESAEHVEREVIVSDRGKWVARLMVLGMEAGQICQELELEQEQLEEVLEEEGFSDYFKSTEVMALEHLVNNCEDVKQMLSSSSVLAARLCTNAIVNGRVGTQVVSSTTRLKVAQDMLDRTGHSQKNQVNVAIVGDVATLVNAYEKRKVLGA